MENGITKEQSKMLQGFAILMMLYHHLFSTPEAFGITYHSLLKFGNVNAELRLAWFFKICVGLYAFISGYGLCKGLAVLRKKKNLNDMTFFSALFEKYKFIGKRLLSFYTHYWLVFVVYVPFRFFVFHEVFDWKEFILNMCGVSSTYNGTWWYVLFYVKMLLLLPLVDNLFTLFSKRNVKICQIVFYLCIAVILFILCRDQKMVSNIWAFLMFPFMECFLMGYVLAKWKIIEIFFQILPKNFLYVLGILGFLATMVVRIKIAKDASSVGLDYLFVPVYAFGFVVIMILVPKLSKFFLFFGKYSTFIWLTHVFFHEHYTRKLIFATGFSTSIYVTYTLISLAAGIGLQLLYQWLQKIFRFHIHDFRMTS